MNFVTRFIKTNHYWIFTFLVSLLLIAPSILGINKLYALYFLPSLVFLFLSYKDFKIEILDLAYFIIFSAILIPPLKVSDSIPIIRPEFAISLIVFPFVAFFSEAYKNKSVKTFISIYIAFLLIQLFSIFYGKFFQGINTGYKDFIEIIRVFSYLLIIVVIGKIKISEQQFYKTLWLIMLLFFGSALIGLFQYFSILSLDSITAPFYSENRVWHVNTRMFGTFVNPNTYGTFISIGIVLSVTLMFYEKTKTKKIGLFLIFLTLFWTLILTESRTALVTLFTGLLAFLFIFNIGIRGNLISSIKSLLIFSAVFVILFALMSSALIDRFSTLLTFMEDPSWQMRLFAWYINFNLFLDSWVFGFGPAFHHYTPTVDSDYILILRRYGVVGFISYLLIYVYLIRTAFRKLSVQNLFSFFKAFMIASFLIVLVGNITNPLFHEMQFMNFWAVLIGFLLCNVETINSASSSQNLSK